MRSRSRGSHLGLLLLGSQLVQVGLDHVPPVTLGVIGLNVYLFLFPVGPPMELTYWSRDWLRLLLAPLHHLDDLHLYYNMASFLWKGSSLERRVGGAYFLYLLSVFSLLTGLVYLLLEAGLSELTQDQSYSTACALGFSGVLFALKVLSHHYHPGGVTYVMGVPVSNRYVSWVELVLIHLTAPGTSLIGHLAGILVGLLYTKGPLKTLMDTCTDLVTSSGSAPSRPYYYRSSGSSGQYPDYSSGVSDYSGGLTEEQQLEEAIRNSLDHQGGRSQRGAAPPPYGFNLSEEELRRRRLRRFDT